jgi:Rps23 Pro-64 3,4-dihydroxylase Tpa1-like proline 4-hydroxylase
MESARVKPKEEEEAKDEGEPYHPKHYKGTRNQWRARERGQEHRDRALDLTTALKEEALALRIAIEAMKETIVHERHEHEKLLLEQSIVRDFLRAMTMAAYPRTTTTTTTND